jgi:hypothetical protein
MQYDFLDKYNELRVTVEKLITAEPTRLMRGDAWLVNAIDARDMTLTETEDCIVASGSAWSTQTMDHEWFELFIPKSDIELHQSIKRGLEQSAAGQVQDLGSFTQYAKES